MVSAVVTAVVFVVKSVSASQDDVIFVGEKIVEDTLPISIPVNIPPCPAATTNFQTNSVRSVDDVSSDIEKCKSRGDLRILRVYEKKNDQKRFDALTCM